MSKLLTFLSAFLFCLPAPDVMAQNVRITDMDAMDAGSWVSGNIDLNDVICVYADTGKKTPYTVTITDDSTITPGGFNLENQTNTQEIPYTVYWGNSATKKGAAQSDGVPDGMTGANDTSETCAVGGFSANMTISIDRRDLESAPAGVYTAEVEVLIEP